MLAANVRTFLSSAPYCAPENWSFLIDQKLAKPLTEYDGGEGPDLAAEVKRVADALEEIKRMWTVSPPGGGPPHIPHPSVRGMQ